MEHPKRVLSEDLSSESDWQISESKKKRKKKKKEATELYRLRIKIHRLQSAQRIIEAVPIQVGSKEQPDLRSSPVYLSPLPS